MTTRRNLFTSVLFGAVAFAATAALNEFCGLRKDWSFTAYPEQEGLLYATAMMFVGFTLQMPTKWKTELLAAAMTGIVAFCLAVGVREVVGDWIVVITQYQLAENLAIYGAMGLFIGFLPLKKVVLSAEPASESAGPATPPNGPDGKSEENWRRPWKHL